MMLRRAASLARTTSTAFERSSLRGSSFANLTFDSFSSSVRLLSTTPHASVSLAADARNHLVEPHLDYHTDTTTELSEMLVAQGLVLRSPVELALSGKPNPIVHPQKTRNDLAVDFYLDAREYLPSEFDEDDVDEPSEIDDASVNSDTTTLGELFSSPSSKEEEPQSESDAEDDQDDDGGYFEEEAFVPVQIEIRRKGKSTKLVLKAFVGRNEDEDEESDDEYLKSLPQYESAINNLDRVFELEAMCVADANTQAFDLTKSESVVFKTVGTNVDDFSHVSPSVRGQDFDGVFDSLCTYLVDVGVTAETLWAVLFQAQHAHDSIQAEFGRDLAEFLKE